LGKIYESLLSNEDYFPVLKGKQLKAYYDNLLSGLSLPALPDFHRGEVQYGHFFPFQDGCLYAWAERRYDETETRILRRFAAVIDLTFRRYNELQKSEANAKEAIKQASLDRVRAEIASMRTRGDLDRITPLIWEELTVLGIPFIRCGVFIMDEGQKLIHTFLSTPDGKAIGAFHTPFDTSVNFEKMVDCWRHKVPYIDHWQEEAFSQFADTLVTQGAIASRAQYMRTLPHDGVHLNFLPFLQGMLYVGNSAPLSEENVDLIQAVAEAFSTAYARYEDFNKLEAAKQQVDNTLTQLKSTQNKLIQSEKMASLGELTAGIAHEIQNPLNFVNNFSEVSAELIDEMEEELSKGDTEEAMAIANDIKQNLEKIRHHGKRADGIVKGMLQHSRASSNVKEPTDINKLADEYLHLAYHGLRAKDKSFNAELISHLAEKLPKANVVPQDIGRVILNMINNAFYATQQKAKTLNGTYKPKVTVTTCAEDGQVIIKVKDNGNGIPEAIKDKIMQPFFTTKPTGEGTGLGLSLSYDIVVKGHGGNIEVVSKESEGSEFIIRLPLTTQ
jgi:signal transduction histidine kinase